MAELHMWEVLMQQTKARLQEQAAILGERLPASWKKERMARRVAELALERPERLTRVFRHETLQWMRNALRRNPGGRVQAEAEYTTIHIVMECAEWGLAQMNAAQEADISLQLTQEWMEILRQNPDGNPAEEKYLDAVSRCAQGIVDSYGALPMEELHRLLCRCFPNESPEKLRMLLDIRNEICQELFRYEPEDGETWISSLDDPERFAMLFHSLRTEKRNYSKRLYTRRQYEHAAAEGVPVLPANFDQLHGLLTRIGMDPDEAEDRLLDAAEIHTAQVEPDHSAFAAILGFVELQDNRYLQQLLDAVTDYLNDVPMWVLLGHTPNEITRFQSGSAKIVPFPKRS